MNKRDVLIVFNSNRWFDIFNFRENLYKLYQAISTIINLIKKNFATMIKKKWFEFKFLWLLSIFYSDMNLLIHIDCATQ